MTQTRMLLLSVLLAGSAFCFYAPAASGNMLVNADFETGDMTGWSWTPTQYAFPNMDPSVGVYTPYTNNNGFRVKPGTDSGHWGVGNEQGGYLWQTMNLSAGSTYDLTGDMLVMREIYGSANHDAGRIRLYMDTDLLWDWDVDYIAAGASVWSSFDVDYTPTTSGAHDFKLLFTRTYTNYSPVLYHYADDMSVTPELSSGILLLLGALPVGLAWRRRRNG